MRKDGSEELLPSKMRPRPGRAPATCCYFDTWGGGGCGDPLERDPALVVFDVEAGLVSEAGALRYGVVVRNERVDKEATAALRLRMAKDRGQAPLFDRGFVNIAELKSRCLSETGLPPPAAPRFSAFTRARAKPAQRTG